MELASHVRRADVIVSHWSAVFRSESRCSARNFAHFEYSWSCNSEPPQLAFLVFDSSVCAHECLIHPARVGTPCVR